MRLKIFFPCCQHISEEVDYTIGETWIKKRKQKIGHISLLSDIMAKKKVVKCKICEKKYVLPVISYDLAEFHAIEKSVFEPLNDNSNGRIGFSRLLMLNGGKTDEICYLIQNGTHNVVLSVKERAGLKLEGNFPRQIQGN